MNSHKLWRVRATVLASALACATWSLAHAATTGADAAQRFDKAPALDSTAKLALPSSPARGKGSVTVVVKLGADPITVAQAKAGRALSASEKQQIRASLQSQQAAVTKGAQALGAKVLFQFQNSLNGVKVSIPRDKVAALAALPGVVDVLPVGIYKLEHQNSMPLIGAPTAWDPVGGNYHGEGVKIAVIDTGIDYTHANFAGPGTVGAFNNAFAHSTDPADPAMFGPTAPKVKGGTDLVGDDYDAGADPATDPDKLVPHPDPNPLDCNGHGSHTAGTAAGIGVLSSGFTYAGSYDTHTLDQSFNVAPGVAPKADLYAVRVFGCEGSTDVVDQAIEWAVDHDMQVINMSLGAPFGNAKTSDAEASTNAAKAGVIVVASAGNSGNNAYIVGSPSTGDDVISVAAVDPVATLPGARMNLSTGKSLLALNANNATPLPGGSLPVAVLRNPDGTVSLGCDPADYTNAGVSGKVVVTVRGTCARVARAIYGQKAGAAAVVMINTDPGYPPFEGTITSNPDTGEHYTVTIPFLGVKGVLPNGTDAANMVAADGGTTTLTAEAIPNPTFRSVASFSSGGPRGLDSLLKPDVAAPGVSILSTAIGTGTGGTRMSGTSMAAPHTAGLSALVLQAHPTWSSTDVRRAVVNTANPSLVTPYSTRLAGGGLIQAPTAVATSAIAFTDVGDTHLGFGFQEIQSDFVKEKPIKVRNNGSTPATFDVSVSNKQGEAHTAAPSATQIVVPPGGVTTFTLTLTVPAATVRRDNVFRNVAGVVNLTPVGGSNGGVALHVPYFLAARGLSNVTAKMAPLPTTKNPSGTVSLANVGGPIAGNADFYALGIESGNAGKPDYAVRAAGVQSFDAGGGDQLLVMAINTWGRANSESTREFDVYVDVNGDGEADYIVIGVDFGAVTTGSFDGRFGVFVLTLATGELRSSGFLASAPTDSSTVLLPFFSTDLCRPKGRDTPTPACFSSSNPRMSYQIIAFDLFGTGFDVAQGTGRYNPWTPAISQGDFQTLAPNATATSAVTIDTTEWAKTPARGVMVVTTDNKAGPSEAATISFTLK